MVGDDDGSPARSGQAWRRTTLYVALAAAATCMISFLHHTVLCARAGTAYTRDLCSNDLVRLYHTRGLDIGKVPYFDHLRGSMPYVEYPVLTGWFMQITGDITRALKPSNGSGTFFKLTAVALLLCAVFAAVTTAWTAGRRSRRVGLMVALSPGLLLTDYLNWDLLAVALTAGFLLLWARKRLVFAGVLLGLAIAAKFYPVIFLGPLLLLCLRAGRMREFGRLLAATLATWLVVNVPVMIGAWAGWSWFYTFSQARPVDWGSTFMLIHADFTRNFAHDQITGEAAKGVPLVNAIGQVALVLLCLGIAALALGATRRPRLTQLLFLVTAAFIVTNKVWSPQYVLWLLPLAALARPKLPGFIIWQAGEVLYVIAVWWYFVAKYIYSSPGTGVGGLLTSLLHGHPPTKGINLSVYHYGIAVHLLALVFYAALVVWDILRPDRDLVRADGDDDPAGGPLDGAEDRFTLSRLRRRRAVVTA